MGFGGSIKGFDWDSFGFLLDAELEGASSSVLTFVIDYSWELAFVLGMGALAWTIIQMIAAQNVNITMIIFRIVLTIALISFMSLYVRVSLIMPMKWLTLSYSTKVDMIEHFRYG